MGAALTVVTNTIYNEAGITLTTEGAAARFRVGR